MTPTPTPPDVAEPSADADESALVARLKAREHGAVEVLMRRYNQRLFRVARAILKSDPDAEEAVQEAYLSAWRGIGAFRAEARLATWLTRIVINVAYARLRRVPAATVISLDTVPSAVLDVQETPMSPPAEQPDDAATRSELRALLERRIDALPEQYRTVFILRDVEELSVEDTAACLDIPEATVRTRAFRARALLRESLARDIDTLTPGAFSFAGERCDRIVAGVLARIRRADDPDRPASPSPLPSNLPGASS
jgi:RNA polymerase sigma-70 factor (ECF subfamily)